jgi:hypothetical protein
MVNVFLSILTEERDRSVRGPGDILVRPDALAEVRPKNPQPHQRAPSCP